jgi:hypothetical protein
VHSADGVVQRSEAAHRAAAAGLEKAETALHEHEQEVAQLQAGYASAVRAAQNPGTAPRSRPLRIALGRPEEMSPAERQLLSTYALELGGAVGAPARKPSPLTTGLNWREDLARMDASRALGRGGVSG